MLNINEAALQSNISNSYTLFSIENIKLAVIQSAVHSIETILDLEPIEFDFDTDCVSIITTDSQVIPVFSTNKHLDSIGNFPISRRACLVLRSENNQAFGISVDTISATRDDETKISYLPEHMLSQTSTITQILELNNSIYGVIDSLILSKIFHVNEFYNKHIIMHSNEAMLTNA